MLKKYYLGRFFWALIPVKWYQNMSGFASDRKYQTGNIVLNLLHHFKFIQNQFQICFKFASKFALFLTSFQKFPLIGFRKLFTHFSLFQIYFRSKLICLKMKQNLEMIPFGNIYFGAYQITFFSQSNVYYYQHN